MDPTVSALCLELKHQLLQAKSGLILDHALLGSPTVAKALGCLNRATEAVKSLEAALTTQEVP